MRIDLDDRRFRSDDRRIGTHRRRRSRSQVVVRVDFGGIKGEVLSEELEVGMLDFGHEVISVLDEVGQVQVEFGEVLSCTEDE